MMPCDDSGKLVPWKRRFLVMLPVFLGYVAHAFRNLRPEAKEEAVQGAIASVYAAYARLVARGRENLAFASVLAKYAAAQIRAGRLVGGQLNIRDVSSVYCQRARRIKLQRLDRYTPRE